MLAVVSETKTGLLLRMSSGSLLGLFSKAKGVADCAAVLSLLYG
jgi:hypothetical protein